MAALRDRSLRASAKELGQRADLAVWGLVVDLAMPSGVATIVALDDGHASLYTSTGGGVLGFGAQPAVKSAAERLVAVARNHVAAMMPTSNFSLPAQNFVRFYVLAAEGVRTAEVAEPELASGASSFAPLFVAAHELLSQLRLASSRPTTSP